MKTGAVGLDIAKQVFQVHGADKSGKVVLRRKLRERSCPVLC
jgi:transposase